MINRDLIDMSSLIVDGIDMRDYPDFCDGYFSEGCYLDGTPLPDDVLEALSEDFTLLDQKIMDMIY